MIKINLLRNSGLALQGAGADVASVADDEIKRTALVKVFALFLLPFAMFAYERMTLGEVQAAYDDVQKTLNELRAEKGKYGDASPKVEEYTKEKQRVDHEMEIIRTLAQNRLREVKALDAIQTLIPEKVWLERIALEGNKVSLEGNASSDIGVTQLIRALEGSAFFSQVEPKSITQDSVGAPGTIRFEIECQAGKSRDQ